MALLREVNYDDLEYDRHCGVGVGAYGSVYKALWKSQDKVVAVKELHTPLQKQDPELVSTQNKHSTPCVTELCNTFGLKEAEVLNAVHHCNIIQFFGAVTGTTKNPFCLVTEYAENGSVYAYLGNPENKLEFSQILKWANDVAQGMNYLHNGAPKKIIHRDLKSKNVVISDKLICKICDFGESRFFSGTAKMSKTAGTYGWMAPEVIREEDVSDRCDTWSYGVVLWELLTREVPFKGLADVQVMYQVAKNKLSLTIPTSCPRCFADLMKECWLQEPKERPCFSTLVKTLDNMLTDDSLPAVIKSFLEKKPDWRKEINEAMERLKKKEDDLRAKEKELDERELRIKKKEKLKEVTKNSSDDADHAALPVDAGAVQKQDFQDVWTYPCEKGGLVLVINNMNFVNQPQTFREGSQRDVESIQDLFDDELKQFYNKVIVKDDCTLDDMHTSFQSCRDQLGSGNYDQFICFILSHGDSKGIETTDGKYINQEDIEEYFNAKAVRAMADRPKVFVFEAPCHTARYGNGVKLAEWIRADSTSEGASGTASDYTDLPVNANILTAYASMEGTSSFRNIDTGSWFIQRLCKVFKGHYKQQDVMSMLTEVIHDVSSHRVENKMQLPVVASKLTKKMFLKYK